MKDKQRTGLAILLIVIFGLQAATLLNAGTHVPGAMLALVIFALLGLRGVAMLLID